MWYENEITNEIIEEFFSECAEYTRQLIKRNVNDVHIRNHNGKSLMLHHMNTNHYPFRPKGAVISSTNSCNVWDFIRSLATKRFGTHFVVTGHPTNFGKYLSELPSAILMPMNPKYTVQHAGYFSQDSYGIDIRNIGRLRPWSSPIETHRPSPVFPGEEKKKIFQFSGQNPRFFWWAQNWREEFFGEGYRIGDTYYEKLNQDQIETLAILLKVLNAYTPLEESLILPSHCIQNNQTPILPGLSWSALRRAVRTGNTSHDSLYTSSTEDVNESEFAPSIARDEIFLNEVIKTHIWRSHFDNGNMYFLNNGPGLETISTKTISQLRRLGYEAKENVSRDLRMFLMSMNYQEYYLPNIATKLEETINTLYGE